MQCPKPDCMYLHELGDEAASFTKEEMQVLYLYLFERGILCWLLCLFLLIHTFLFVTVHLNRDAPILLCVRPCTYMQF